MLSARYRLVECASVILFLHVAPAPALLRSLSSTLFPSSSYEIFKRKEVWKKRKKSKKEQGFSLSPGTQEQFSLLLFCLHIKSSSLCAVCSTLYTFPRNDIEQSSSSRAAFCSYYGLANIHSPWKFSTQPPAHSPAFCVSGVWHCCSALCLVIYPKKLMYVRRGWYTCCRL